MLIICLKKVNYFLFLCWQETNYSDEMILECFVHISIKLTFQQSELKQISGVWVWRFSQQCCGRLRSVGMFHFVTGRVLHNILKDHSASILTVNIPEPLNIQKNGAYIVYLLTHTIYLCTIFGRKWKENSSFFLTYFPFFKILQSSTSAYDILCHAKQSLLCQISQ